MKLSINDKVTWSSAAGQLTGVITNIVLDLNAARKVVPWIDVKTDKTTVRLCATDSNLIMMRVQLVDNSNMVERTNIMTGNKFMEPADRPYFCSPSSETFWTM